MSKSTTNTALQLYLQRQNGSSFQGLDKRSLSQLYGVFDSVWIHFFSCSALHRNIPTTLSQNINKLHIIPSLKAKYTIQEKE